MVDQIRSSPTLRHKRQFAYECSFREAMTVQWGATMGPVVGRATHQNFGNIRDYSAYNTVLLEEVGAIAALLLHRWPLCPEPGGCYATITPPDPPRRARRGALA